MVVELSPPSWFQIRGEAPINTIDINMETMTTALQVKDITGKEWMGYVVVMLLVLFGVFIRAVFFLIFVLKEENVFFLGSESKNP